MVLLGCDGAAGLVNLTSDFIFRRRGVQEQVNFIHLACLQSVSLRYTRVSTFIDIYVRDFDLSLSSILISLFSHSVTGSNKL